MSESASISNSEQVRRFVFSSKDTSEEHEAVEILIPEQLQASYGFYTWPCAPYLAWYLYDQRKDLPGKHILELGAGTALPSILAAKCGARVTITDSAFYPQTLQHIHRVCVSNKLSPDKYQIIGITWGFFFKQLFELSDIDLIIGSDCFYEPHLFEDILVTVAFLLEHCPHSKFLCSYQERSADWSIEHLLHKWSLTCRSIDINSIGVNSCLNLSESIQDHTIHLLEITKI
ncbi:UNVERIFIED_CONTAM: hypothetical protein PYX00_000344 [Menopon gallinae]|uniref:Methyltransferase-like protein 23 n=1 Tax=Menopon gallinae TaxID=328185 RepID=A0AAW2I8K8_9NEOP